MAPFDYVKLTQFVVADGAITSMSSASLQMATGLHLKFQVMKEKYALQAFSDCYRDFSAVVGGRMP
jgi:hypothetical protein